MTFFIWLQFALVCLLGAMSPGPSLALIIHNSINYNRISGIIASIDNGLVIFVYATVTVLSLEFILLKSEQISKYFTSNWEVRSEKEILTKSGEVYIPDRLVFNGKEVTIIDYKTGNKKLEHQIQINNYANALKEMGYRVAATELIYTKDILRK